MSFLVDIGGLSPCSCNEALDGLYKAIGEDHDIWAPHENLYIRDLVEWFTKRGLVRHEALQAELSNWLVGRYYLPGLVIPRPAHAAWGSWTANELEVVRVYLQSMHDFSLEDSALLVDYLIQKYLPVSVEEGEHLVVKANLLGRAQSHGIPEALVARIAVALPGTVADALRMFTYPQASKTILQYGWLHAGENIVAMGDNLRHQIKNTVLKHMAERIAGARPDEGKLQQELFDKFAAANRDWRRIALTEAGEMANQGFIASLPAGIMVRRMEQYYGACAWCKKIDGHLFRVTTPDDPNKDGDKDIWVGKTNIGRSSSPYKKTDEGLVPRTASELYWVAAGTQHPHCRGVWIRMSPPQPGDDPEFGAWLRQRLGQKVGI